MSGSMGIKIFGPGLEFALSGAPLFTYKTEEEAKKYEEEIFVDSDSVLKQYISKTGNGILVQSSTLGSLEAMLLYLSEKNIEIAAVGLGHIHKKDVVKIHTIHANQGKPLKEHMTILAFDVKVLDEAESYAKTVGVKIFTADIIYHLFDKYIEYEKACIIERKKEKEKEAVFPVELKILQPINKKDPIIIGVEIVDGILKIGTPIYAVDKKVLYIVK
jgi:translation initiation factor 5B